MRKALVAAAEEYFVRTLEEGGQGAGTAVMKRLAYIVKQEMFDYEAEILPMIKARAKSYLRRGLRLLRQITAAVLQGPPRPEFAESSRALKQRCLGARCARAR